MGACSGGAGAGSAEPGAEADGEMWGGPQSSAYLLLPPVGCGQYSEASKNWEELAAGTRWEGWCQEQVTLCSSAQ